MAKVFRNEGSAFDRNRVLLNLIVMLSDRCRRIHFGRVIVAVWWLITSTKAIRGHNLIDNIYLRHQR